jgi:hypothetical protein
MHLRMPVKKKVPKALAAGDFQPKPYHNAGDSRVVRQN